MEQVIPVRRGKKPREYARQIVSHFSLETTEPLHTAYDRPPVTVTAEGELITIAVTAIELAVRELSRIFPFMKIYQSNEAFEVERKRRHAATNEDATAKKRGRKRLRSSRRKRGNGQEQNGNADHESDEVLSDSSSSSSVFADSDDIIMVPVLRIILSFQEPQRDPFQLPGTFQIRGLDTA
ncbi:hypothetical protein V1514DRAFT_334868 [Lipomyces japonicus]|uniref:uncharacterized protein n=1 Tax=Lipomyces japonicus TaxID=56871 RepID=UPI0034CEA0B8